MLRVGVLVSGGGTNLQAILDAEKSGVIRHAKVVYVLSNNASAYALQRAASAGIANECISPSSFETREDFHRALLAAIEREQLDLIVLAGYLVKLPDEMIQRYRGRIMNIHPSLIPSFCGKGAYGLKVHEQALSRGVKVTGVTVHFADERYDCGPIIAQRPLVVEEGWSVAELEAHIHEVEHELYPDVIQLLAEGRVHVGADGRVVVDPAH